jgi:hypothetical protein
VFARQLQMLVAQPQNVVPHRFDRRCIWLPTLNDELLRRRSELPIFDF